MRAFFVIFTDWKISQVYKAFSLFLYTSETCILGVLLML